MGHKWGVYMALIGVNLLYALVGLCTKLASLYAFLSWQYLLSVAGAVCILGLYAVCWQQIIARVELSFAYMFKGLTLIFALMISALVWSEPITWQNIVGAIIIVAGIMLYARQEAQEVE